MQHFYIMPNTLKVESFPLTERIAHFLHEQGKTVYMTEEVSDKFGLHKHQHNLETCLNKAECAIVLGGDGTILSAARELAVHDIPILGVNLGNFGFLAEVEAKDIEKTLERILMKHYCIEERMMLETTVIKDGVSENIGLALNDLVASRTAISRMVGYSIFVNGNLVNHYAADGIIISTPTGSTAYNLSAGGPILAPYTESMVITPICPHSLTARSIVLSGNDEIRITFDINRSAWEKDLMITIDGQQVINIQSNTQVIIKKSQVKTKLLKLKENDFYTLLRRKLECK